MFGMGYQELLIVMVVVLVLFGGEKIPELMRGIGKGVSEFKNGVEEAKRPITEALESEVRRADAERAAKKEAETIAHS